MSPRLPRSTPTESPSAARAALLVVAVTCAAYANSFAGAFVFDDAQEIADNPAIRSLLPPWEAMFVGNKLPARPLPYLTFAIDRAVWGPEPFGFHVTNLAIHVVAALALFDLVRTTLAGPALRDRFGPRAVPLAAAIAAIWAVHPLQTQAVTYVYQRIESLAGMFSFLALAAFARAAAAGWSHRWLTASAAAAAGAMASKESAAVLPFTILAWDWFFAPRSGTAAGGFGAWLRDAWSRRWFYLCLCGCWGLVAGQVLVQRGKYQELAETKHPPLAYALTQPEVILHYLSLVVRPVGQCLDYQWPIATGAARILPALAAVLAAVAATARGTLLRRPWASLGVWFFLGLAVTSSILPVEAVANEHRMYQPLAAVVTALVLAATAAADAAVARGRLAPERAARLLAAAAGVAVLLLATLTLLRNSVYTSSERMWLDVYARDPDNLRANWFLAGVMDAADEVERAEEFAGRAVATEPSAAVFNQIALARARRGDPAGGVRLLRRGLSLQEAKLGREHRAVLRTIGDLAATLSLAGERDEAARLSADSLAAMRRVLGPADPVTLAAEGTILERRIAGDAAGAVEPLRALAATARRELGPRAPTTANVTALLARALEAAGAPAEAEAVLRRALADCGRPSPLSAGPVRALEQALAGTLAAAGRHGEAVAIRRRHAEELRRERGEGDPQAMQAAKQLAEALAAQAEAAGDRPAARRLWRMLLDDAERTLGPDDPETRRLRDRFEAGG
jgi:tetratricopeptide (TPR) repeat protein